jgi:RHS repeat-associated protein
MFEFNNEINEYYFRTRRYDPHIGRLTTIDPAEGCFKDPLSLNVYLYCQNDPMNRTDPTGRLWGALAFAREIVTAGNVRNVYSALLLSSGRDLLDITESLSILQSNIAGYIDERSDRNKNLGQFEEFDPAETPLYFAPWRVTREECAFPASAELRCQEEIAVRASLAAGALHLSNYITGPLGPILNLAGGSMLIKGNVLGLIPFGLGVALDYATFHNAAKIREINDNADQAIKGYCDCSRFK